MKWIWSQFVLLKSGISRARARCSIIATKNMKDVRGFQSGGAVGHTLLVYQQRKRDACFFPKQPRIIPIAQSYCNQTHTARLKFTFVFTQLRDMLAAEDSAIMP